MKKLLPIIYCFIAILLLNSCNGHFFNPRYYYNKNGSDSIAELPDTTPETPPDEVPEDEDPFKNGAWNDPGYGGYDASKFKTWLFKASFQKDKLPIYTFFEDDTRTWIPGVMDWNNIPANYYNGIDGENKTGSMVGDVSITALKVYQYVANNPLYSKEGYLEGRLDRFNFYSINGKASAATLKQYLIAVDTYSKFIFAFGAITGTTELLGEKIPMVFEAIERHGDKRPFFEYDPIGYIKEDGSVVLYEHYKKEFVSAPTEYLPKIHTEFEKMAEHKENGQGRSPYLRVDVSSIDPNTILDNLKGKKYGIRDILTLYEYSFDSTGKTLTLTPTHFYDGKLQTETYTFSKVADLTALEYKSQSGKTIIITGFDEYNKIKDGIRDEYILNYQDPGPDFIYRVRGKKFVAEDGSCSYTFSIDGKDLTFVKGSKVYKYTYANNQDKAKARAAYKLSGNDNAYWGIRLADNGNIKDGFIYGSQIEVMDSGTALAGTISSYKAIYNADESVVDFFVDAVANKSYSFRDYDGNPGDGRSLTTFTYQFSKDGKQIVYTENVAKQDNTITINYTLVKDNGKTAIYRDSQGVEYTFKVENNAEYLHKNDNPAGVLGFLDKGPYFLDVVRDTTYNAEDGSYSYIFSHDGKTLTYKVGDKEAKYTFKQDKSDDYTKAAYWEEGAWVFGYWALKVSANGTTIHMSTGALAYPEHILRDAAYGYPGYIHAQGGVSVDRFISSVAGETYRMRVTGNSTLMQYYKFSVVGNSITHVVTNTQTGLLVRSNMYFNYRAGDKATYGTYNEMSSKQDKTFSTADNANELKLNNVTVGYKNYNDPGVNFKDRVAGRTYTSKDGKKYVFSADGSSFDFYDVDGSKKNTFSYESHSGNVGKYTTGGIFGTDVSITLSDYNGIKDGQMQEGSITAYLELTDGFASEVKGKTYYWRDYSKVNSADNNGESLTLYTYTFSQDGKQVTYTTTEWNKQPVSKTYNMNTDSETYNSATYTYNGETIELSIQGNNNILYKGNILNMTKVGEASFVDKGPIFRDRVLGNNVMFKSSDGAITYTFSNNGNTLVYKNGSTTYTYEFKTQVSDNYSRAIYKADYWLGWAGFELSNNDNIIKATRSGSPWESSITWDMTFDANRVTQ